MSVVQLDAAAAAALAAAEPGTELVGPDGTPVGGFVPARMLRELKWMLAERQRRIAEADAAVTLEQLQASDAAGGRIPHAEVMRRLGLE